MTLKLTRWLEVFNHTRKKKKKVGLWSRENRNEMVSLTFKIERWRAMLLPWVVCRWRFCRPKLFWWVNNIFRGIKWYWVNFKKKSESVVEFIEWRSDDNEIGHNFFFTFSPLLLCCFAQFFFFLAGFHSSRVNPNARGAGHSYTPLFSTC